MSQYEALPSSARSPSTTASSRCPLGYRMSKRRTLTMTSTRLHAAALNLHDHGGDDEDQDRHEHEHERTDHGDARLGGRLFGPHASLAPGNFCLDAEHVD